MISRRRSAGSNAIDRPRRPVISRSAETRLSPSRPSPRSRSPMPAPLIDRALKLRMHDLMVKTRVMEDQLIAMNKAGDGYFWIGGPGEEAWGVALGLLVDKGEGP